MHPRAGTSIGAMLGPGIVAGGTTGTTAQRPRRLRCLHTSGNIQGIDIQACSSSGCCKAKTTITSRTTPWCSSTIRRHEHRGNQRLLPPGTRVLLRQGIRRSRPTAVSADRLQSSRALHWRRMDNRRRREAQRCRRAPTSRHLPGRLCRARAIRSRNRSDRWRSTNSGHQECEARITHRHPRRRRKSQSMLRGNSQRLQRPNMSNRRPGRRARKKRHKARPAREARQGGSA